MENDNNQQQGLQIDLKPEIAKGVYANLALITHSSSDFVLDFATMLPGMPRANSHAIQDAGNGVVGKPLIPTPAPPNGGENELAMGFLEWDVNTISCMFYVRLISEVCLF